MPNTHHSNPLSQLRDELHALHVGTTKAISLLNRIEAQEKQTVADLIGRIKKMEDILKADDTLEAQELADKQAQIDALKAQAASGNLTADQEAEFAALEAEVSSLQSPANPTPPAPV